ncbi:hypothetical protein RS9916_27309 [Synechococcus sp. RS9916]|nr:hypothetical protein RS9916_27309 [Synechococcus sp. RS9916]
MSAQPISAPADRVFIGLVGWPLREDGRKRTMVLGSWLKLDLL